MRLAFSWRLKYAAKFPKLRYPNRKVSSAHVAKRPVVQSFDRIPGPRGLPWLGAFHHYLLSGGPEKMFLKEQMFYQQYGPIFKEHLLGRTFVHIMDPDEIEKVFRAEGPHPVRGPVSDSWMTYRKRRRHSLGVFLR